MSLQIGQRVHIDLLGMRMAAFGLVTERDFQEAEAVFPGIDRFYRRLNKKPPTFLDLLRLFLDSPRKQ